MPNRTDDEKKAAMDQWKVALASFSTAKPRYVENNRVVEDGRAYDIARRDFLAHSVRLGDIYVNRLEEVAEKYLEGSKNMSRATAWLTAGILLATLAYSAATVWSVMHPIPPVVQYLNSPPVGTKR